MRTNQPAPATIDEYIAAFPLDVQAILEQIRLTIREAAPGAVETISYGMPTFTLNGRYLVYFAGYKRHIGLYPAPTGIEEFQEELAAHGSGRGTLKIPLDRPIPFDLIRKFVAFRAKECDQAEVNQLNARTHTKRRTHAGESPAARTSGDQSQDDFPPGLAQPALRALSAAGYRRLEQLTRVTEADLLKLHGMGPKALGLLHSALQARGLSFADLDNS